MKLGRFSIICKPTFQVPKKFFRMCLFDFQKTWMIAEIEASSVLVLFLQIKVQFISYTIVRYRYQ